MADAEDLKSSGVLPHGGSNPPPGTCFLGCAHHFRHSYRKNLPPRAVSSSRISVPASGLCSRRRTRLIFGGDVVLSDNFDLIVIGCGPAGEKAGAQAAYFGKRVAVIERAEHTGGSCINTGTVPSKTLRESALYFSGLKQRGLYGIDYSLKENLTVHDFMHHEREVVEMERQRILKNLALHHIELVRGQASFEDARTVGVSQQNATEAMGAAVETGASGGVRRLRGAVI